MFKYIFTILIFCLAYVLVFLAYSEFMRLSSVGNSGAIMQYAISLLTIKYSTSLIVIYALFASGLGYLISKFEKFKRILFRILIFVFIILGCFVLFFSLGAFASIALSIIFALIFKYSQNIFIHDLILILAISGLVLSFVLVLSPFQAILFFIIMSVLDFFAVYISKHSDSVARLMIKAGSFSGIIIPYSFDKFNNDTASVLTNKRYYIMGAFDLMIPLIFCLTLLWQSSAGSLLSFAGVLIGLMLAFIVSDYQKQKMPVSFLSFCCFFSLIIYNIYLLI